MRKAASKNIYSTIKKMNHESKDIINIITYKHGKINIEQKNIKGYYV